MGNRDLMPQEMGMIRDRLEQRRADVKSWLHAIQRAITRELDYLECTGDIADLEIVHPWLQFQKAMEDFRDAQEAAKS